MAPVGSMMMLNFPMSATGVTSSTTFAPSSFAFRVAEAMSSTST